MEARIYRNQIILPIGTAITFKMIDNNRHKIELNLSESEENLKFFALFDQNDVDFEIEINNSKCIHGIGYTLIVNNGYYDYYVGARQLWTMETLYSRGRKLHFISEKSEVGQTVVSETAQEYDLSYSEAAAVCSRIEFSFDVEKVDPKPVLPVPDPTQQQQYQQQSRMFSATPTAGLHSLSARSTSYSRHSALHSGEDVVDVPDMRSRRSGDDRSSLFGTFGSAPLTQASLALAFDSTKFDKNPNEIKANKQEIGDKGVVCFGEQSDQLYNIYNSFSKDNNLIVKPFVVELRFSKK